MNFMEAMLEHTAKPEEPKQQKIAVSADRPTVNEREEVQKWVTWDAHFAYSAMQQVADICAACFRHIEEGRKKRPHLTSWTKREAYVRDRLTEGTIAKTTIEQLNAKIAETTDIVLLRQTSVKIRQMAMTVANVLDEVRLVEDETVTFLR